MGWFSRKRHQREQAQAMARLREHHAQLQARVAELEAEDARLTAQLAAARTHSGNASKPPSSDLVKPNGQRPNTKSPRRLGGQPGPPRHECPAFAPDPVDQRIAYRKYARQCSGVVQFCLAHLIRDAQYLCKFPEVQVQRQGQRRLAGLQALFWTLHRKDQRSRRAFEAELTQAHQQIWQAAIPSSPGPFHRLIGNMAGRFYQHGEAYFQFLTTPAIEPTNNGVEQALRFVGIDRQVTQGTRSVCGQQICERLWTVMATWARHRRSPFQWICQAMDAGFKGQPVPCLILDSS
jgi:hypothetical protein